MRRHVLVVSIWCGCGNSGPSGPHIDARWDRLTEGDCRGAALELSSYDAGAITFAGLTSTLDRKTAHLTVPADKIPAGATTIGPEIEIGGKRQTVQLKLPKRELRSIEITFQRYVPTVIAWSGFADRMINGRDKGKTSWQAAANDAGDLVFGLPCGVVRGTTEKGTVALIDGLPTLVADVDDATWVDAPLDQPVPLTVVAKLEGEDCMLPEI